MDNNFSKVVELTFRLFDGKIEINPKQALSKLKGTAET